MGEKNLYNFAKEVCDQNVRDGNYLIVNVTYRSNVIQAAAAKKEEAARSAQGLDRQDRESSNSKSLVALYKMNLDMILLLAKVLLARSNRL